MQSLLTKEKSNYMPVIICYLVNSEKNDTSNEFEHLVESAGYTVLEFFKDSDKLDNKFFLNKNQRTRLKKKLGTNKETKLLIIGTVLSPMQYTNLKKDFKKYKIMDQFELILRLFGSRTNRQETIIELQMAALKYQFPFKKFFLLEQKFVLDQMGYGRAEDLKLIDMRYSKETYHFVLKNLEKKLTKIKNQRVNQRKIRLKKANIGDILTISIVGYTNAGKSSFLNTITDSKIETSNKLFTTLATSTRSLKYQDLVVVLTDTVGFFYDLPNDLFEPFTSTLEESLYSNRILLFLDCSESINEIIRKLITSIDILKKIDEQLTKKIWILFTKNDLLSKEVLETKKKGIIKNLNEKYQEFDFNSDQIGSISSHKQDLSGFDQLLDKEFPKIKIELEIPIELADLFSLIHKNFNIVNLIVTEEFWLLEINTRKLEYLKSILSEFKLEFKLIS